MKEFLPLFIVYEVELDGRSFRTTAVIDWTAPISEGSLWAIQENLEKKYEEVNKEEFVEKTDEKCPVCGKDMVVKFGRFGKFLACSDYPECKTTKSLKAPPKEIGMKCPTCLASPDPAKRDMPGEVIIRRTKRGKVFFGCSRYPACDYASWTNPKDAGEARP